MEIKDWHREASRFVVGQALHGGFSNINDLIQDGARLISVLEPDPTNTEPTKTERELVEKYAENLIDSFPDKSDSIEFLIRFSSDLKAHDPGVDVDELWRRLIIVAPESLSEPTVTITKEQLAAALAEFQTKIEVKESK